MSKKAKKVEKPVAVNDKKVKDSTEIDDLFSLLSSSKKSATFKPETDKDKDKKGDEVTLSELEDLEQDDEDNEACEGLADAEDEEIVKGTAYDPKKDDVFPAAGASNTHDDSDFFDSRGLKRKTRALTEDGLPIYSPKELKIGMGGGTDLCPFDCNCCY